MAMNDTARPATAGEIGLLSVAIEEGPDGAALVHSLGYPGCVSAGRTVQDALDAFPGQLSAWLSFRQSLGLAVPDPDEELEITVDDWVSTDVSVSAGESDAFFDADLRVVEDDEFDEALHLLGDLRGELLRELKRLPRGALDREDPAVEPAREVLNELARAQWWTLTRLGASPLGEVPQPVMGRLDTAMALTVQQITGFARAAGHRVLELDGELWSPRKVLRRLLWLEWWLGHTAIALLPAEMQR